MKLGTMCALILLAGAATLAQAPSPNLVALQMQASKEYNSGDFAAAARDLVIVAKSEPKNLGLQRVLAQSLFRSGQYPEAAVHFQTALDLGDAGDPLWRRVETDQLVMSLGMSGNVAKAHEVVAAAIARDPDYALNYYNQACAYAAEGQKAEALASLKQALDRRANMIKGEAFPDPRKDDSFQGYLQDADFQKLVAAYGYR